MNLDKIVHISGRIAGVAGVAVCLLSGLQRAFGGALNTRFNIEARHFLFDYETGTVFDFGVALMVFYCVAKLHQLGGKE